MAAAGENSRAEGTVTGGRVRSLKPAGTPGKALRWRLHSQQPRKPPGNPAEQDIRYGISECDEGSCLPRY